MGSAERTPVSTYRLQFSKDFGFVDARAIVPYLAALGVTDCYSSPFLMASPGSSHGYDICNHLEFNPDLGTKEDFESFTQALRERSMGLILDFVPNHMGLDPARNNWWHSVLENGRSSPFSEFFDIDWDPATPGLKNKILLPILHDQYGAVLERGELRLGFASGALHLAYADRELPIDPREAPRVFREGLERLHAEMAEQDEDVREFLSIVAALENLPPSTESDASRVVERRREQSMSRDRLVRLAGQSTRVRQHIDSAVSVFNGVPNQPATFDRLHELLEAQPYRLAHWRTAFDEINYRRFFDVNDLGGLRMELPRVFQATHGLILRLIGEQTLTGLRVDHVDGLLNPSEYLHRLQNAAASVRPPDAGPLYVVVEKVLAADEMLPSDWPVAGTTGYGFLNDVNGVFVDTTNEEELLAVYDRFTGRSDPFAETAYHAKRLIMASSMASELAVLTHALNRIAESDRRTRDFTMNALRKALVEVVACLPVYRTYVGPSGFSATDRAAIDFATDRARQRNPAMAASLFGFLRSVLLTESDQSTDSPVDKARLAERRTFAMKFQQYSAPVQAKGVEDTACYRHNVLISLNEVGGNPGRFGRSVEEFHAGNSARLDRWQSEMTSTTTHDTKRGEDARARINVISEMPGLWQRSLATWMRINASRRTAVDREPAPDCNDEYLFYQALLGAWPAEPVDAPVPCEAPPALVRRMRDYMQKVIKEGKSHTSWVNENVAYQDAVSTFVETTLAGPGARSFLCSFVPFQRRVAVHGMINSLAQLVLKIASPGVADCYQGAECWGLHLVDPDNRGRVDFGSRQRMLDGLLPWIERAERGNSPCPECRGRGPVPPAVFVDDLLTNWHDARLKMFVTACGLRLRGRYPELFTRGTYQPLGASGLGVDHLIGFARSFERRTLIALVPRLTSGLVPSDRLAPIGDEVWGSTAVSLPQECAGRTFRNVLTGEQIAASTRRGTASMCVADVFRTLPVAMLWSDAEAVTV